MFKTSGDINVEKLKQSLATVERNYIIQPNDYIDVRVYTNRGERIFDPNGELPFGAPGGLNNQGANRGSGRTQRGGQGGQNNQNYNNTEFLVQYDGTVKLPMVDYVKVTGLTLLQTDSLLQTLYAKYYVEPFVSTRTTNNRVFVLGANGGTVIQMINDNMNLFEALAQSGGITREGKAHNIRIIRDYLDHDPIVQVVDLSTIEGMKRASLYVEPNDVIYIEPNQRPFFALLRDITPVINTFISVATTYLLIRRF
ncbi:polysaccharide biosynthesis/export family protein [Adhaeribacter radiodurans]|uniref:Polysaccharide biosynthesis/export family protein n=1 Tax=Adhaeribacter radiodurans TaxID=2745197 RepID=A0A7L7LEN4_9BACT|nr:polysaccharide biosynthesis/export family protein [Adhaeribacter radiodurans]QMU31322.1 polysaccharide biosynthesis/export family protein [Adhaeribacter radiodurans]